MVKKVLFGKLFLSFAMVAGLLVPSLVYANGPRYSVGLGFQFASGDYGTGYRTNSVYAPFTAAIYPTDRVDVSLEIPFLYQSTSSVVAGVFTGANSQSAGSQTMMSSMDGSSMTSGSMTTASSQTVTNTQSGLGDVKLRAGYVIYTEEKYVPAIRPSITVKFPTADKNKFLGTGAFDECFAVELTKWFGRWFADGEAGYNLQGKSTVIAVRNYLSYYAGGGYQLSERWRPMLLLKGNTPSVEGGTAQMEARLQVRHQLTNSVGIDGYLSKGMTSTSPDYGTGLSVSYDF